MASKNEDIRRAKETFRLWHDKEPKEVTEVDIPEPQGDLTPVLRMNRLDYSSDKWENRNQYYYHIFKKNPPLLMKDGAGNYFIVGKIQVTPGAKKKKSPGIDDWPRKQKKEGWKPLPKAVARMGILELIAGRTATGEQDAVVFGDRLFVAHPDNDYCYITSALPKSNPSGWRHLKTVTAQKEAEKAVRDFWKEGADARMKPSGSGKKIEWSVWVRDVVRETDDFSKMTDEDLLASHRFFSKASPPADLQSELLKRGLVRSAKNPMSYINPGKPIRIVVGGPPHSGKSTFMGMLHDKLAEYNVDVNVIDLDLSSPTMSYLKSRGREKRAEKIPWDMKLAQKARRVFEESNKARIILGDSVGLITDVTKELTIPADAAIIVSKDEDAVPEWKKFYDKEKKPLLVHLISKKGPGRSWFDPSTNTGIIYDLARKKYLAKKTNPDDVCVEGVAFEIARSYGIRLKNKPLKITTLEESEGFRSTEVEANPRRRLKFLESVIYPSRELAESVKEEAETVGMVAKIKKVTDGFELRLYDDLTHKPEPESNPRKTVVVPLQCRYASRHWQLPYPETNPRLSQDQIDAWHTHRPSNWQVWFAHLSGDAMRANPSFNPACIVEAVLNLSDEHFNYLVAKLEWRFDGDMHQYSSGNHCACGHYIEEECWIKNVNNGNRILLGSTCVEKYLFYIPLGLEDDPEQLLHYGEQMDGWRRRRAIAMENACGEDASSIAQHIQTFREVRELESWSGGALSFLRTHGYMGNTRIQRYKELRGDVERNGGGNVVVDENQRTILVGNGEFHRMLEEQNAADAEEENQRRNIENQARLESNVILAWAKYKRAQAIQFGWGPTRRMAEGLIETIKAGMPLNIRQRKYLEPSDFPDNFQVFRRAWSMLDDFHREVFWFCVEHGEHSRFYLNMIYNRGRCLLINLSLTQAQRSAILEKPCFRCRERFVYDGEVE